MAHPVRGIKGSDLLGFDSTALKIRIKGKNTTITFGFTHIDSMVDSNAFTEKQSTKQHKVCLNKVLLLSVSLSTLSY